MKVHPFLSFLAIILTISWSSFATMNSHILSIKPRYFLFFGIKTSSSHFRATNAILCKSSGELMQLNIASMSLWLNLPLLNSLTRILANSGVSNILERLVICYLPIFKSTFFAVHCFAAENDVCAFFFKYFKLGYRNLFLIVYRAT